MNEAKLYIIITVDVESPDNGKAFDDRDMQNRMVYGQTGEGYWGFPRIMEICEHHNCIATFFISVFEHKKYGENSMSEICTGIKQKGHDIQLHIHPVWAYGRRFMHEYSRTEQAGIIGDGKALLEKWTGQSPVAYRGGAYYSVNRDTLEALKENGIPVDSSNFYGNENCRIGLTRNRVTQEYGVIEVPITIFKRASSVNLGLTKFKTGGNYIKTDIDWATLDELLGFVEQARMNNLRVMVLFLHSYSFLNFDSSFDSFQPDYDDMEKFEGFLSSVSGTPGIEIITMKQFYDLFCRDPGTFIGGSDYVPVMERQMSLAWLVRNGVSGLKFGHGRG